jgi:hypothetical protein
LSNHYQEALEESLYEDAIEEGLSEEEKEDGSLSDAEQYVIDKLNELE